MFIYHYSDRVRHTIRSKRAAGILSANDIKLSEEEAVRLRLEAPYIDNISFFFDPIPSALLATLFGAKHAVWFRGNVLFEHAIDPEQFEDDVLYRVVESARKTRLLDDFSKQHDWTKDDPAIYRKWVDLYDRDARVSKELGRSRRELLDQIRRHQGVTEPGFLAASKRIDFRDGWAKYAANVPHLMVYPKSGTCVPSQITRVCIGSDKRDASIHL